MLKIILPNILDVLDTVSLIYDFIILPVYKGKLIFVRPYALKIY